MARRCQLDTECIIGQVMYSFVHILPRVNGTALTTDRGQLESEAARIS